LFVCFSEAEVRKKKIEATHAADDADVTTEEEALTSSQHIYLPYDVTPGKFGVFFCLSLL